MPNETPKPKLAIIGAGSVGSTVAYACMLRGIAKHIVLHDVQRTKVDAEILDLNHGLQFVPMATIEGSDDLNICADADVIVIVITRDHPDDDAGGYQPADQQPGGGIPRAIGAEVEPLVLVEVGKVERGELRFLELRIVSRESDVGELRGARRDPFVISNSGEKRLARRLGWYGIATTAAGSALMLAGLHDLLK